MPSHSALSGCLRRLAALALGASLSAAFVFAAGETPARPTRWVTDLPGFLSEPTRSALDARLEAYEHQTGHQVLVWIGKSTGDVPIEDFAVKAFKAWTVGQAGKDDGVVLFILADDRKARFEVGYGLEGPLPDVVASRIIRETLAPRLASGDRDGAITAAVEATLATISGPDAGASADSSPQPRGRPRPAGLTTGQKILFGLLAVGFLVLLVTNPSLAFFLLQVIMSGAGGGGGGRGGGGGGWSGGGGRSGGGGASGSW